MYACSNVHVLGLGEREGHPQAEQESLSGGSDRAFSRGTEVRELQRRRKGDRAFTALSLASFWRVWDKRVIPVGRTGRVAVPAFSCVQIRICIVLNAFKRDCVRSKSHCTLSWYTCNLNANCVMLYGQCILDRDT